MFRKENPLASKEDIIRATTDLIIERGDGAEEITVREIASRAGVGLGLVNYHFGNKDRLIEVCVERIINGIVERFRNIRDETSGMEPLEKLIRLGDMTLDFLFEHSAMSRISILSDMRSPSEDDNTHRTVMAFLPLVAACRPDLDDDSVMRRTWCLIATMQQIFLRHDVFAATFGVDLLQPDARHVFHARIVRDVLGVESI